MVYSCVDLFKEPVMGCRFNLVNLRWEWHLGLDSRWIAEAVTPSLREDATDSSLQDGFDNRLRQCSRVGDHNGPKTYVDDLFALAPSLCNKRRQFARWCPVLSFIKEPVARYSNPVTVVQRWNYNMRREVIEKRHFIRLQLVKICTAQAELIFAPS